eukprot:symbB.v1.2.024017.t1/scaffold2154.1/size87782/4
MDRMDVVPKITVLSILSLLFLIGSFIYLIRQRRRVAKPPDLAKVEELKDEVRRCIDLGVPETPETEGKTCPICLEMFQTLEEVKRLDCHHCFHGSCLATWGIHRAIHQRERAKTSLQCPLCRQNHRFRPSPSVVGARKTDPEAFCV